MKKPKDNMVIFPNGGVAKWNDWVPTDSHFSDPTQLESEPIDPEREKMKDFFLPRGPQPQEGSLAAEWKREGRCQQCGELGRIHMSTMICSKHGPYT